ncbi:MAG: T9SS type A sorting domain-containing protein [Flavobacteriales bacterium]|nr:T9SS type A sorting domain-containing protein [Flavobacteriales bacterium]
MKKIYTLIFTALSLSFTAQVEGTWKLSQTPGALGVGPTQGDIGWWSNSAADLTARACLFDDSISFNANGDFMHYMDGSTWIETWQGVAAEQCGTPVAPHDGSGSFTYVFANNQLTVNGTGAHIGLAKATNSGELSAANPPAVPTSNTYEIMMSANGDTLTADIDFGGGWWRFVYTKTGLAPAPPAASHTVTFNVHTDLITGNVSADGIYIGGGFVGNNDALLLDDSDGDGIWSGSTTLPAAGGHFTILNGNCSDWSCKEDISGQPCADAGNYNDRNNLLGGFSQDTTLNLQYGSCDTPGTGINELDNKLSIFPNPSNGVLNIKASQNISSVNIYNMIGNLVMVKSIANNQSILNIESLTNGVYFIEFNLNNGSTLNSKIIKR